MRITLNRLLKLNACELGVNWYKEYGSNDLLKTLLDVNKVRPDWSRWLFTKLMTKKQNQELAIYAAKLVLAIYEAKYPTDKRPRFAIQAAVNYLKNPTLKNKKLVRVARTDAADAAADAASAYAAAAAYAADAAAYAASAASAYAADAAAAAYAADAADAASSTKVKMQEKIIRKAVKILERKHK
jgi:hypothetical protein